MKKIRAILFLLCITGCTSLPEGVDTVKDFDLNRYLGKWYEIARLDHSFEKNLIKVTAEYSLRNDGGVKVLNRGYNSVKDKWEHAEGKAYFQGDSKTALLKVSFFGPFYGTYNVIELDKDGYQYALVCGPDRSYLWILSKSANPDKKIIDRLVKKAASLGFETDKLIYAER